MPMPIATQRRARHLALALIELGETIDETRKQLLRWRYDPAVVDGAVKYATQRSVPNTTKPFGTIDQDIDAEDGLELAKQGKHIRKDHLGFKHELVQIQVADDTPVLNGLRTIAEETL